ncbi:hypothetical protein F4808DRAFT_449980 [Astrocystis sublimbata]|nr:hypothetical protein F4808DRAFT_449980 [Astrocystis sublimbata]
MADLSRQSAFMPTIKCSNCGNQVEISMMGEHICGDSTEANAPEPAPPPPGPELLGGATSTFKENIFDRFNRAPPTVDTSAANRPFNLQDQLTPVSASTGSQAISPKTPMNGRLGPGTSSDEYFSPAIAGSPRRPSGYGFSAESEGEAPYGTSPNKQATNLLTRMNSIAPGPFEVRQNRSTKNSLPRRSRDDGADSSERLRSSIDRPGTAASSSSHTSGSIALPKMPRKNGYGGFGPPQRDEEDGGRQPFGLNKRSETFPEQRLQSHENGGSGNAPIRAPSAPGLRPERSRNSNSDRSVGNGAGERRPSNLIRDTSRPPPPRTSLIRPVTRDGSQGPSINLADEFGTGNPYHSPSVSQSSNNSGFSQASQGSRQSANTSPPRSIASRSGPRRPSDTSGIDALMDDLQNSINGMQSASLTAEPLPIPKVDNLRPADSQREPTQSLRLDPTAQPRGDLLSESPVSPGSFPNSDKLDAPVPDGQGRMRSQTTSTEGSASHKRQPSRNPRPRGNCKACQEPITGKSISSADGRLTGRYHKACFVCATCKEPFSSATFYVHGDRPYCEQHYHKLNGSLCRSCNRGIEGQYLEDEVPQKYHPSCFRCGDCGTVLRDGYFDVNGKAYCERDAWRRMQAAARAQQMGPPPPPQQRQGSASGPSKRPPPPGGVPNIREPPRGLPSGPSSNLHRPFGLPTGQRLMPGQALGRGGLGPMQRMEKRMTRLGMM